tara:strand:+ start:494 stop:652 length:159 start_codon:yes stop_codon:yes gene_type:complete
MEEGYSRSLLKAVCPVAVARFDREMGKYRRRHWKHFKEWMGWGEKIKITLDK